jgi:DNA-binding SARP family transcriptional activator
MGDLISLIWDTEPPVSAVNIIHKYVGTLRRLLEPDLSPRSPGMYIVRHSTGYHFTPDPQTVDVVMFRRLAAAAKVSVAQGRPDEALGHYLDALRLCHGSTGDALADTTAAAAIFAGVNGEFCDAAVAATDLAVPAGRAGEVLPALRRAVEMGRFHEPVHASLVAALGAVGHQAEALTAYQTIRDRLAEELGIDPGRELREAQQGAGPVDRAARIASGAGRTGSAGPDVPARSHGPPGATAAGPAAVRLAQGRTGYPSRPGHRYA